MCEGKKHSCPICDQSFIPEDGMKPIEHLAKGVIKVYREMQNDPLLGLVCPRCGVQIGHRMSEYPVSRYVDVYICHNCGADEAVREEADNMLPFSSWTVINELLMGILKAKCKDYIEEKDNPYPLCDNPACDKSRGCSLSARMTEPE